MTITIYGRAGNVCMACRATDRFLKAKGIVPEFRDVDTDPEAAAYARSLGFLELPVVEAGEERWSGFRPDKLRELVAALIPA